MRYHNILKDDMLNGDGLRVVLFVSGCIHNCYLCQNPITHDINGGLLFDDAAKEELFKELEKDYISGVTFSGGDPLHPLNRDDILTLAKEIKRLYPLKTIWCYTGYSYEDIKDLSLLDYIDVLVDGKFVIDLLSPNKKWVGSSNQRVIDIKKSKLLNEVVLCE